MLMLNYHITLLFEIYYIHDERFVVYYKERGEKNADDDE